MALAFMPMLIVVLVLLGGPAMAPLVVGIDCGRWLASLPIIKVFVRMNTIRERLADACRHDPDAQGDDL